MNSTAGRTTGPPPRPGQRAHPAEADAEEDGVEVGEELGERQVGAEARALADGDAADAEEPGDLGLGEAVHRLVGGDAELVEPAGLGAAVHKHDVVAEHGEAVGAGEPCRAGADHGDALARRRGAGEGLRAARHQRVGGEALQPADLDRLALGGLAHAGLLAEGFRRADAGAHAAEDVLARGSSAPPPRARRVAISRMNIGMSIEVGQAATQGAS